MNNPLPGPNPYAPPTAQPYAGVVPPGVLLAPLSEPLYTPNQVALATFLGTPLGGFVLMALNERRLGRTSVAVKTILLGVLATAVLLGLSFMLPDNFPSFPIPLASVVGMRAIAQSRHGALLAGHFSAGGRRASGWAAAGLGLLALFVVLVPLVLIFAFIEVMKA